MTCYGKCTAFLASYDADGKVCQLFMISAISTSHQCSDIMSLTAIPLHQRDMLGVVPDY